MRYFEFRWSERFFLNDGQTRASCQRDAILVTEVQTITQSFVMVPTLRGCVARRCVPLCPSWFVVVGKRLGMAGKLEFPRLEGLR